MKPVSRDQTAELIGRFAHDTNWGELDHDVLQDDVISLPRDELGRRWTAFMRNGCRLIIKGPSVLFIDRSKPFDSVKFIGRGWTIEEEDERALALAEIDLSNVRFESGLAEGETIINGEEKLKRLKALPDIRLDAKTGQTLYEEPGQPTLRFLHDHFGVSWFELAGTVLRGSFGSRYFLCLHRDDDGSWLWDCGWLGGGRGRGSVSPLFASST